MAEICHRQGAKKIMRAMAQSEKTMTEIDNQQQTKGQVSEEDMR